MSLLGRFVVCALLFSSAMSVGGCDEIRKPMSDDQLVSVLVDLHLLDARTEIVADLPAWAKDSVLAHHGVTAAQFESAIRYWAERPEGYLEIYNRVIDSLSAEQGKIEERLGPAERLAD